MWFAGKTRLIGAYWFPNDEGGRLLQVDGPLLPLLNLGEHN